ncbi:MAG: DUF4124 domain-containing protein [Woeseia sp.]
MLLRTCIGFALLLAATATLAEAYRWVDENGVVHYSDRPQPGAEEVELESAPAINIPRPRTAPSTRPTAPADAAQTADVATGYESLTVASPGAEETLWNIGGVLEVTLNLQPALRAGHQVRVYFDGNPQTVSGTQFQLQEVFRGVHNLQAEVLDPSGQLMIRSQPSRFYVQQTTIVN